MKNFQAKRLWMSAVLALAAQLAFAAPPQMPRYRFENFTTANGLPDNQVFVVLVDGKRIWAGTRKGLAVYENHVWKSFIATDGSEPEQGTVLSLALDKRTGDLWVGTMGGLNRISAGRLDKYTQWDSGLSNDVIYGVSVEGENVWVATAINGCRLNLRTGQWSYYNEHNTPMDEPWTSSVSAAPGKVYYGIDGSGVLEFDQEAERWKKYGDPDGENEMVLARDQGLIHEIVSSVSYVDNVLWVATTFGDSRYDGRYWHNFLTKDSGLPSNFTNFVKGVDGQRAWFCTDKGLAYYDGANWAVYRSSLTDGKPEMTVRDADGNVTPVAVTTAPSHNYILGIDFDGNDIWVATAKGLSHGILQP
jgi:ligand-binding sensor domain-containing protein